jgi:hypothetical protein
MKNELFGLCKNWNFLGILGRPLIKRLGSRQRHHTHSRQPILAHCFLTMTSHCDVSSSISYLFGRIIIVGLYKVYLSVQPEPCLCPWSPLCASQVGQRDERDLPTIDRQK